MTHEDLNGFIENAKKERSLGNFDKAEQLANEVLFALENSNLLELEEENENRKEILQAKAFLELALTQIRRGNFDAALEHANQVIAIAEEHDLLFIKSKAWNSVGLIYNSLGVLDKALEYYILALNAHRDLDEKSSLATVTGNIGTVYLNLGDFEKALEYFSKALETHQELVEKSSIARVMGHLGVVYHSLNNFEKALEYYTKSLDIHLELNERANIASVQTNIGLLYSSHGNQDKALECYNHALDIFQELGDKSGVASVTGNIGGAYYALGDFEKTIDFGNRALNMYQELGQKSAMARFTGNIGAMYSNQNYEGYDYKKAEGFLTKAIAMSIEIGAKGDLVHQYRDLANLYEILKRDKEALDFYKKYHELEKQVQSEEATKQSQLLDNRRKVEEAERDRQVKLARFQEQEKILLNILPAQIAERIIEGEKRIADLHEHVSVFFSDIVGFTKLSQTVTPDELLSMLNDIFSEFDRIARRHGLEKIKTIGDAYMAVAGVPMAQVDHAERAAAFAIDVIEYMKEYRKTSNSELQIRVGLHCGRAIAGVIGENKFAYDLWGDSVNTASRMESHGEAGKIHVSEDFRNALESSNIQFINRGEMEVKGKGKMTTYFLEKVN